MKYGVMEITEELVTPAVAERWLGHNKCNRKIRKQVVSQYKRDMERDVWLMKPIPICFDENNELGNGQHTLSAIVASGVPQRLLVARNVPRKSIAVMDMGAKRTITDIAHFIGEDIDSKKAALARILVFGIDDASNVRNRSFDELFRAYQAHQEVIDFVISKSSRISGMSAPTLSVCARALYTHDESKVARFLEILKTGIIESSEESAAIKLRDFCRSLKSSTGMMRVEIYRKSQTALLSFLNGAPMTKIYGTDKELFPIPEAA